MNEVTFIVVGKRVTTGEYEVLRKYTLKEANDMGGPAAMYENCRKVCENYSNLEVYRSVYN